MLGLVRLLSDHGITAVTEEEYSESQKARHEYVGPGNLGNIPHLVDCGIIPKPSITADMFLEYDPVVEGARRWYPYPNSDTPQSDLVSLIPHVRGTCLGIGLPLL